MVELRLQVYYENELENYINETQKEQQKIVINLHELFFISHYTHFLNFHGLDNLNWDIIDNYLLHKKAKLNKETLFTIIGSNVSESLEKSIFLKRFINDVKDFEKYSSGIAFDINCIFKELKSGNSIKEVIIEAVEL